MRLRLLATLVAMASVLGINGCGGSSSSTNEGGSLNVHALWQQPDGADQGQGAGVRAPARGGFGPTLPRAVKLVSIVFESASGVARCVAVDARRASIDPQSGQRLLVLRGLPAGPGSVTIFGYPTDPGRVGPSCEGLRFETPSFRSDPKAVEIVPGTRTDAGDIEVFAVPFLLRLDPPPSAPPASVETPFTLQFTVADALAGVALPFTLRVTQNGLQNDFAFFAVSTTCDDATAEQCSERGDLGVTGFRLALPSDGFPLDRFSLTSGPATLTILATNRSNPPRSLDFGYDFIIRPGVATPTPAAATPTPTPTPTALSTGTITGTVINCLTGAPLAATVDLLSPITRRTDAGADGRFTFADVPLGDFGVQATATGFIASAVSGMLTPEAPSREVTVALCPLQAAGVRIVLTWGNGPPAPADLDAHLRGPATGVSVGDEPVEFHLDFRNDAVTFPNRTNATLDIDSQDFGGPETVTVTGLTAGIYRYCVHDFSERDDPQAAGIEMSNAQVQVFLNNQQAGTFSAPSGRGTVWEAFRLDTTLPAPVLLPGSLLTAESDPDRVCRRDDDPDGDGLTDAQEAISGTDPNLFDTNGNGISDGQDVIDNTVGTAGAQDGE